jgi:outer membrane protein assembly factor BamD (BamD/ComL family)
MKKNSLFVIALLGLFIACQSEESLRHDILVKEETLMQSTARSKAMDSLANVLIADYDAYATKYPKDSMTPTYIIREGQLYSSKRDYQKAAELFNKVCVQYSSDRWASYALFFQALAYSDWAQSNQNAVDVQKNVARSKSLFADFLKKYPTHSLVKDETILMEMVLLSDEEMLQRAIQNRIADSIATAKQERLKLE